MSNVVFRKINFSLNLIGFNAIKFIHFLKGIPFYFNDYRELKKQNKIKNEFSFGKLYPILNDKYDEGGVMSGHYFHQDLLVASLIFKNSPIRHIDVGSRVDGFVAHVAAFRTIEVFDIRAIASSVENIIFQQADLTNLPEGLNECCDSLSSLHAIEHFGLGRYGDLIDIDGHLKAIDNLSLMLKPNGKFYFAVPIGRQRIEFNAHRVFNVTYLIEKLSSNFKLDHFHFVDDNGDLFKNVLLKDEALENNFGCSYGCGIFELTKI